MQVAGLNRSFAGRASAAAGDALWSGVVSAEHEPEGEGMNRYLIPLITAVLTAGVLLGGCTAPPGIKALDRQASAEDRMPEGIGFAGTQVKGEDARLLAENDGIKYFAAKADATHEACVVIVPQTNPSLWVSGCGSLMNSGREVVTVNNATGKSAVLVEDGLDTKQWESEGWTRVHDNVLIPGS